MSGEFVIHLSSNVEVLVLNGKPGVAVGAIAAHLRDYPDTPLESLAGGLHEWGDMMINVFNIQKGPLLENPENLLPPGFEGEIADGGGYVGRVGDCTVTISNGAAYNGMYGRRLTYSYRETTGKRLEISADQGAGSERYGVEINWNDKKVRYHKNGEYGWVTSDGFGPWG